MDVLQSRVSRSDYLLGQVDGYLDTLRELREMMAAQKFGEETLEAFGTIGDMLVAKSRAASAEVVALAAMTRAAG